jgi:hypothetical protein
MMKYANEMNTANMEFVYSTPSKYIQALKEEQKTDNLTFPIKSNDFWHYQQDRGVWSGTFSNRPGSKKHIKDSISNSIAHDNLFSLSLIDQATS